MSIMAQTNDSLSDSAFTDFTNNHRDFLGNVNDETNRRYVWPGGEAFNTRGGLLLDSEAENLSPRAIGPIDSRPCPTIHARRDLETWSAPSKSC